jgi:hypothetical protein
MSFQSDIEAHYVDKNGLVSPYFLDVPANYQHGSGNGLNYTGYYAALLAERGELTDGLKRKLGWAAISARIKPGLYSRGEGHPDHQAVDDYVGIGALFYLCEPALAREVVRYGQRNPVPLADVLANSKYADKLAWLIPFVRWRGWLAHYHYNNVTPTEPRGEQWLGRQLQLVAHLKWACRSDIYYFKPTWLEKLVWLFTVLFSGRKNDPDSWRLSYLLIVVAGDKNWLNRLATKIWWRRLRRVEGTLKQSQTGYFGEQHPLVRYCPL